MIRRNGAAGVAACGAKGRSDRGSDRALSRPPGAQGSSQGSIVQHIQRATHWHALPDPGHGNPGWAQLVSQPMRGGGSVNCRTKRKNHLGHVTFGDPAEQPGGIEILRANA